MTLILVGGGARSGKSNYAISHAQSLAKISAKKLLFIATAERSDDEMSERIDRHIADRPKSFVTIEEPTNIAAAISAQESAVIVVDCLTLWISNLMGKEVDADFNAVINSIRSSSNDVILITNEVGEGIVPMHLVSRAFRDLSGQMNQAFGKAADEVYFLRFGIAQKIK
jgi:adenosylcobinamide kinase/adenosylcobinamide-phosphate guanylyltransferase